MVDLEHKDVVVVFQDIFDLLDQLDSIGFVLVDLGHLAYSMLTTIS